LERVRRAGFVKEAVVGDVRYVYLTERAAVSSARSATASRKRRTAILP